MYRKCTTGISAQHQKQVELALLELMQKAPYESITVTQLCQSAGISRRVFYHLFNNKTDALHAMLDHIILSAESYRPEIPDQALRFFLYWKEQHALLDALYENQLTSLFLERMVWIVMNEDYDVRRWLRRDRSNSGKEILVFFLSGLMGMTYNWYLSGYRKSPEEMAALLTQLLQSPGN